MKRRWDVVILTFFVTSLIIGFFLTVQLRIFGSREGLESLSLNELTLLYNNLNTEVADQKAYLRELEIKVEQYSSIAGGKERILKNMLDEIEKLKVLSGTASVEGEGIEIEIYDENNNLETLDIIDLVNELKSAGAFAVSVNDVRIRANSAFSKSSKGFVIDGRKVASPYRVLAVGDAETLYSAVTFPGGIANSLEAVSDVAVIVERKKKITVRGDSK